MLLLYWSIPEIVTGCSQKDAMSLNRFLFHYQNYIEEDAAVSERYQATEQGLRVLCAAVGVAGALLQGGLEVSFVWLSQLLILRHPRQKCSATSCSRMKSVRQQNQQRFVPFALQIVLWTPPVTVNKSNQLLSQRTDSSTLQKLLSHETGNRQVYISTSNW